MERTAGKAMGVGGEEDSCLSSPKQVAEMGMELCWGPAVPAMGNLCEQAGASEPK